LGTTCIDRSGDSGFRLSVGGGGRGDGVSFRCPMLDAVPRPHGFPVVTRVSVPVAPASRRTVRNRGAIRRRDRPAGRSRISCRGMRGVSGAGLRGPMKQRGRAAPLIAAPEGGPGRNAIAFAPGTSQGCLLERFQGQRTRCP